MRDLAEKVKKGLVISTSTRIVDLKTQETLLLYLGHRYGNDQEQYRNLEGLGDPSKPFPDPMELGLVYKRQHLAENVNKILKKNPKAIIHDGFPAGVIDAYSKAVQAMAYVNPPQVDQTDERHSKEVKAGTAVHKFPISAQVPTTNDKRDRDRIYSDEPGFGCERAGVWHFIEGREVLGHHKQGLFLADDMCQSSTGTATVVAFFKATQTLEAFIESVIKVGFPHEYKGMKELWHTGKYWDREFGCHIGRVIVYKLPTAPHWDGKNFGVSVSFGAGRGYLYVPQLGLVFEYGPRALVALYASWIIHSVGDWDSEEMDAGDETTPGRIGTVFYISHASMEVLIGKEEGWTRSTGYGVFKV
ncbi:hypothetical protein B0H13DRAFT_2318000 [Mycena leptocephala]|nr:hypothetical protein B0H13DRAFT_2318000 [Mycena leptocephala]